MAAKLLLARVLSEFFDQGEKIKPNSLVEGEKEVIESLQKAGVVDAEKNAVDYVKSQGAKAILIIGDGVDLSDNAELIEVEKAESEQTDALTENK